MEVLEKLCAIMKQMFLEIFPGNMLRRMSEAEKGRDGVGSRSRHI